MSPVSPEIEVVPAEITRAFEQAVQRVVAIYEGKGDPDRPLEQIEESFERLMKLVESKPFAGTLAKLGSLLAPIAKRLAQRATLRRLVAGKLLGAWKQLLKEVLEPSHPLVAYLGSVTADWPAASLLALASWPALGQDLQGKLIQANTYLEEASNRTGEARFNSTKKLARVLLDELYPLYIAALCELESARIGKSVTPLGNQARSFGAMVRALKASLPDDARCLVDFDANKIRNAFDHGRARWIRETDHVELNDENFARTMPTTELLGRLSAMHTAYVEGMIALFLHGTDFAVRIAERHLTWEVITRNLPDFDNALQAAILPSAARLKPWFENVPVKKTADVPPILERGVRTP